MRHRITKAARRAVWACAALLLPGCALAETRHEAPAVASHPMDGLTPDEIRAGTAILREAGRFADGTRMVSLALRENPKAENRGWRPGEAFPRRAHGVLHQGGKLFEAEIDLKARALTGWKEVADRQAAITVEEMMNAGELPKKDPAWQAAMAKRGFTDHKNIACLPLAAGPAAEPAQMKQRLLYVPCVDTAGAVNNLWGKPIEGVIAIVDLAAGKVASVIDLGVVPAPPETPSHAYADSGKTRPLPKPVEIASPAGQNVTVEGGQVRWDKWSFHVRLEPRLGTVLSLIRFDDRGTPRDIAYQISASEMYVPYMDPAETWSFRAYMDIGEYGFGSLASPLRVGEDCPAGAHYLDLAIADNNGAPLGLKGAVCIFERPTADPVWRHTEMLNDTAEVRPNVELVVRMAPVVGNYDYLVDYVFDRAGQIDVRLGAYGIDATKGVAASHLRDASAAADTAHGTLVAPRLLAVNHDHYMSFRLDLDVDGTENRLVQDVFSVQRVAGAGLRKSLWQQKTETIAVEGPVTIPMSAAQFRVESAERTNRLGYPTSYQLLGGHTATSLLSKEDAIQKRAAFTDYTLWASAYAPGELYASGDYPNQNAATDGLPLWVSAKRPIANRDLVLWYTIGFRHIPRSEDWPAMPGLWHGFRLRPFNFFDRNPALDVPPVGREAAAK